MAKDEAYPGIPATDAVTSVLWDVVRVNIGNELNRGGYEVLNRVFTQKESGWAARLVNAADEPRRTDVNEVVAMFTSAMVAATPDGAVPQAAIDMHRDARKRLETLFGIVREDQ